MGLLSAVNRMAKAGARGANDRGILSRAMSAARARERDMMASEPYPGRLWLQNNEMGVARQSYYGGGRASNPSGLINPEDLAGYTPLERAQFYRDVGLLDEANPYERRLLQSLDPKESARSSWGLDENDPVLRMLLLASAGGGAALLNRGA